jgi:hypothetical protein
MTALPRASFTCAAVRKTNRLNLNRSQEKRGWNRRMGWRALEGELFAGMKYLMHKLYVTQASCIRCGSRGGEKRIRFW